MASRRQKVEAVTDFLFLGLNITADCDCSHEIRIWLLLRRKALTNLDSVLKSKDITLPTKVHVVKAMVLSVVMYGYTVGQWRRQSTKKPMLSNWCWRRLESSLESNIKPVNLKGNQPWLLFGRTDAEVEAPKLWLPDVKKWLIGKDPDAGKDWR